MKLKSILFNWYAQYKCPKILKEHDNAFAIQNNILFKLIKSAERTAFGRDFQLHNIEDYTDYCSYIPLRNYEDFIPYIDRIVLGERDVLWKDIPEYFAITSGTTAGAKYIPISKESINHHIIAARNLLLFFAYHHPNLDLFKGKMMFLQGSPALEKVKNVLTGRLSGIVFHHVPKFFLKNRLPSFNVNIIDDWEAKVDAIVKETISENMTVLGGIPPWMIMYLDELSKHSNKSILSIFPNLSLYVHGGVNCEPFKNKLKDLMGDQVSMMDTFPASEGFLAYQIHPNEAGMLLNINAGIFFEFIEMSKYLEEGAMNAMRIDEVVLNVNYVLIISTNAGLWRYVIGDTIKFISIKPYKILVTGRIKQFVSAFGEHVISEEVENTMAEAMNKFNLKVQDFHVCPNVEDKCHDWLIEWENEAPEDIDEVISLMNNEMCKCNKYYKDLIDGNIIQPLRIIHISKQTFYNYYKREGKLGGQNKMNRLSNDRKFAEKILSTQS